MDGSEAVTVRQSNPIGHFIEWKQQNLPWRFLLLLVHLQAGVSLRCMEAVWCFSMSYLFMLGNWRERWRVRFRKRNHWSVCQCLCLCLGFPLSPFHHTHNSKPLHSRHYTRSLTFFSLSPYLSHPLQLWKYNSSQPNFPFTLSIHLPNLYSPACVCTPVWVLAWSVWTQRKRKTYQVGRRWEELFSCKERTPVVLVSGFSIGTQTSVQALSGGSLLQMHMLCNNTDCFWEKKMCACVRTLSFFSCQCMLSWLWPNSISTSGFTCHQSGLFSEARFQMTTQSRVCISFQPNTLTLTLLLQQGLWPMKYDINPAVFNLFYPILALQRYHHVRHTKPLTWLLPLNML